MELKSKEAIKKNLDIEQTPGDNQVLIKKGMGIDEIAKYDAQGKNLVFDIIHFPKLSMTNLGKLSSQAQMAYQMDLRAAQRTDSIIDSGKVPFSERLEVIGRRDPLSRSSEDLRKGQARSVPAGMMHLNVAPHEVDELESAGYHKAKPDEVDIVGSKTKAGAVVLTDQKGNIDNVAMLVDKESYEAHREAVRDKGQARIDANLESTKERMRQYNPKVTIYDKSTLVKHQ